MESRFLAIQRRLAELHQDRTKFFSVAHVCNLYEEFKVTLDEVTIDDPNVLPPVIGDTLILFSLAFINSGHTRESISLYAKLVTLRSLFVFLYSDPSFTPKEISMLQSGIQRAKSAPEEVGDADIPRVSIVVSQTHDILSDIDIYFDKTVRTMEKLPENEYPVFSQVTHLRRDILAMIVSSDFNKSSQEQLSAKLEKVRQYVEHTFSNGSESEMLRHQLQKTRVLVELFPNGVDKDDMSAEDAELVPLFRGLKEMVAELDVFVMTRRWTLRTTDLYQYIKNLLQMLPKLYVNLTLPEELGSATLVPVDPKHKYQYLTTYMSRRAWTLLFKLLDTTEPVSEALSSLYNQLVTMKRCLVEVQLAGGINCLRELYPYQMKLASLDNFRTCGKFIVNGEVPAGQGVLNGILTECFDIVYELKVELEEKGENDADDSQAAQGEFGDDNGEDIEDEDADDYEDVDDLLSVTSSYEDVRLTH